MGSWGKTQKIYVILFLILQIFASLYLHYEVVMFTADASLGWHVPFELRGGDRGGGYARESRLKGRGRGHARESRLQGRGRNTQQEQHQRKHYQ